jgi:predicted PurR-regulated permease PerM
LSTRLSKKKRVLIGIPAVFVTASILMLCWALLSRKAFFIVLISLAILAIILQPLVKIYEERKNNRKSQEKEEG